MDLGERIAAWRRAKRLSQRDLAKMIGVTPGAISQFEGGGKTTTTPSVNRLNAIIDAFGVTPEKFYGRVPRAKAA